MSLPRVTEILRTMLGLDGSGYFQPRHLRRGRLTHTAATIAARGLEIEPEWWARVSGERDDDRVEHEECRPYVEAAIRAVKDAGFELYKWEEEIQHPIAFVGHFDWLGCFKSGGLSVVVDLKNGEPEPWHRLQLALYSTGAQETFRLSYRPRRWNLYLPSGKWVEHRDPRDYDKAIALVRAYHVRMEFNPKGEA